MSDEEFTKTITILGLEIQRAKLANDQELITELKNVIEILTDGQGYLTKDKPIAVRFYRNLGEKRKYCK